MKRLSLFIFVWLAGCASVPDLTAKLTPYRIDVRQGNFVTPEMAAQLKAGQSKEQVRFILGTPLITDAFHADRWDYVYSFKPGHGEGQQRRMALYFDNGKLARIEGDVVAKAETEIKPAIKMIDVGASPAGEKK